MALVFLALTLGPTTRRPQKPAPTTIISPAPAVLQPEPIVTDLQVEPRYSPPIEPQPIPQPLMPENAPSASPLPTVIAAEAADRLAPDPFTIAGAAPSPTCFCGAAGAGRRVCFVVDRSGSMVMAFDYVRRELQQTLARLTPAQYFNVIFYAQGRPVQFAPGRLVRAYLQNRRAALDFVGQVKLAHVSSTTEAWRAVVAALEAAFAARNARGQEAELIFLLTDGEFDHQQVSHALGRLQARRSRPVTINVIACGSRDNQSFLRQLAQANHGRFRFVSDEHLARGPAEP